MIINSCRKPNGYLLYYICTGFWLRLRQIWNLAIFRKSGQISSQILQLQYGQLTTDKTNAAEMSSGVFAILICPFVCWFPVFSVLCYSDDKSTKFIAIPQISSRVWQRVM